MRWADLLDAVVAMVRGADKAIAPFADEPGEYRWILERVGYETDSGQGIQCLHIQICSFPQWGSNAPDGAEQLLFDAECPLSTVTGAVLPCSQVLLAEHSLEDYQQQWGYVFPMHLHQKIQDSLKDRKVYLRRNHDG